MSITRHWFIPGLDINDVPRQHRLEGGPDAPTWHYGHSYEGKAQALDHIPTFLPDDAVSACLRRAVAERSGDGAGNVRTPASGTSGNAITVDAFFHGMLERASEFRNSNVGVFVVEMHVRDALDVVSDKDDEHDETPNVQLLHMIEQMLNIVDTKDKSSDKPLTFHTINDAHSSSAKLCAILEKSAVKPMLVQARIPSPAHAPATQDASGKHGNPPPPAVNMLTVKRRRKE